MNHPLCAVDQRPVHTAGNLCAACWADLEHDLAELAESLLYDLERTLAGLTRTGGSPIGIVVRTAERGLGFDERAGDLLRQLHNALGGWVRVVYEDEIQPRAICSLCLVDRAKHAHGPMPLPSRHPYGLSYKPQDWNLVKPPLAVADRTNCLALWLGIHEQEVRRHEAVGELWQEIHDLAEQARHITDRRPDRRYLGVCSAHIDTLDGGGDAHPGVPPQPVYCDADLYVTNDLASTVDCRQCGTRHHVEHRRAVLLDAVGDQLATAAEISKAIAEYDGREVTVERIRQWYSRGKIAQHPPRKGERWPRYRVGDVRDILDPTRKAS